KPWDRARLRYPGAVDDLLRLTKDNPKQHARALEIQSSINEYFTQYSKPLVEFIARNPDSAAQIVVSGNTTASTNGIRRQFDEFVRQETRLGNTRNKRAHATADRALVVGAIGLAAALSFILLGAVYVNRAVVAPVRSAADAADRIATGDF